MLDGTSHNRDEEPSGIQVSVYYKLQKIKNTPKLQKIWKNVSIPNRCPSKRLLNASKLNGKFQEIKFNPQYTEIVCSVDTGIPSRNQKYLYSR